MVYVFVFNPFPDVTKTVIVFEPTFKEMDWDATLFVPVTPFTLKLLWSWTGLAVTVREVTLKLTEAVYEIVVATNVGDKVPQDILNVCKAASVPKPIMRFN